MSILNQVNNEKLKTGFIFIPCDNPGKFPIVFIASHLGGFGYFAKLNPDSGNGYDPITFQIYEDA